MSLERVKSIYEIWADDAQFPDQWFLDDPLSASGDEIDAREFTEGVRYSGPRPTLLPVGKVGTELAFSLGAFDMPVVSSEIAKIIARIAPSDAEFFPVSIGGAKRSYSILNVIAALDCLDVARSEFTLWKEEDGRPDRLGQYHSISTIRIDVNRTDDHHIFRLRDWPLAILVSNTLKNALEPVLDLGLVFRPAS